MIEIQNGMLRAFISENGGELIALYKGEKNLLWGRDPAIWGSSAPLLFPICGRLRESTYYHKGVPYEMPPHGFAKQHTFIIRERQPDRVILGFSDSPATKKRYPFAFDFSVCYELKGAALEVSFTMENKGEEILPYSLGGHWGFALESNIEEYTLRFDQPYELYREVLDGAFISGKREKLETTGADLPLSYHICDNDTWVLRDAPRACTLVQNGTPLLRLEYPDSPHLLIWTLPGAAYVCLEPWNGLPDGQLPGELMQKDAIHLLDGQKSATFVHRILVL